MIAQVPRPVAAAARAEVGPALAGRRRRLVRRAEALRAFGGRHRTFVAVAGSLVSAAPLAI